MSNQFAILLTIIFIIGFVSIFVFGSDQQPAHQAQQTAHHQPVPDTRSEIKELWLGRCQTEGLGRAYCDCMFEDMVAALGLNTFVQEVIDYGYSPHMSTTLRIAFDNAVHKCSL